MRILILSYYFPPYNASGAIRVGKAAKYLLEFGHDIRVVTAKDPPLEPSLEREIPEDKVIYSHWLNINAPAGLMIGGKKKVAREGFGRYAAAGSLLSKMGLLYKSLLNFPDGKVGWIPFALSASIRLCWRWRPDVIYASGMPFSVFVVASILSVFYRIPWIAEFRDLYVDDHYYPYPRWRRELDSRLERRLISRAIGLVTVSQPLADVLRKKYDKPTEVVLNGFVPDDLPRQAPGSSSDTRVLRIVYTGTLTGLMYELRRDPTPLFQALRFIGALAAYVKVAYYGRDGEILRDIARREGVENYVESYGVISYKEALAVQAQADILLLLLWNSPEERGVYTGKLFEYLGARKPILAIGPSDNVATCLIRERGAGIVAIDPEHIADYLRSWISQKRASGVIPPLPPRVMEGLTRKEQTKRLERFLDNTLAQIE